MTSYSVDGVADQGLRTADHIDWRDLAGLVDGAFIGLRIQDFYPAELCDRRIGDIVDQAVESYQICAGVKRIGRAVAESAADPDQLGDYYKSALEAMQRLRRLFYPYLAPMDKLRLELQEQWPAGSTIERLHGLPMFCGLIRTFREGAEVRPHQDMIHWNAPDAAPARLMIAQLSANIHLAAAEHGGELELWNYSISASEQYRELQLSDDYCLDRARIGAPTVTIKPQKGDLILFDARRIHAVSRVEKGVRVAVSAFLGYRGPTQPLTVYS
jgi:Rps23 Pro-64 3,4-dihydroxylase Tpa1-like proline 4-hydroxylase